MVDLNTRNKDWQKTIEAEQFLRAEDSLKQRVAIKEMVEQANVDNFDSDRVTAEILADKESLARAVPFIDPTCVFKVCDRDVVMVNASSGGGKSTLSAGIVMSYEGNQKPILYISNEESSSEVFFRLACFKLGVNPNSINDGSFVPVNWETILPETIKELSTWVKVKANDLSSSTTSPTQTAEGLHIILENAIGLYSAVILDYYQCIQFTTKNPKAQEHEAQLAFDTKLDYYRSKIGCPIFIMAQSKPMQVGSIRSDFQNNRQKGNSKVYHKVTVVIEIQKLSMRRGRRQNPETVELQTELAEVTDNRGSPDLSVFFIHKDRFRGLARSSLVFQFNRGRYVYARPLDKTQMEMLD